MPLFPPRPAKQSAPTDRDLAIFKLAEINRWKHEKIAQEIRGISRRRVSQIVQNVRLWLANHPADDPAIQTELERKRLAQNLDRLRLEDIIQRAVSALDQAPPTLGTTCAMEGGGPVMRYVRDQPPVDVRLLKTYLRAVEALAKLNDRPEVPVPPPPPSPWLDPRIQNIINFWKDKADKHRFQSEYVEMFAQELGHAFLASYGLGAYVDKPLPSEPSYRSWVEANAAADPVNQDAASSASQTSPAEAPPSCDEAATSADASPLQTETSIAAAAGDRASEAIESPSKKTEKGSAAAAGSPDVSEQQRSEIEQHIQRLDEIEQRLHELLEAAPEAEPERRESLQQAITSIRDDKANLVLRLSPQAPGATITTDSPPLNTQPQPTSRS
jgi:hypothetical protein